MEKLGKIQKVNLRDIWKHEARNFTTWLAKEGNLSLLGEELGITIINPQVEENVGDFAVDIKAEDDTGHRIIIENQLEKTDHDHLGKIITYAAGLQAETIIWIASKVREGHEQAINWLNENTTENANFFLIKIEAWQIDNSIPAPKFNIIAKPNDWAKTIRQTSNSNKVTDLKIKQQEFWNKLRDYGEDNSTIIKSWQKALPQQWMNISIGTSQAHLSAQVNTKTTEVSMSLYIDNNKDLYYKIEKHKIEIEDQIGIKLRWWELPDKKASIISAVIAGDFKDPTQEERLIIWLHQQAEIFAKVFKKYL